MRKSLLLILLIAGGIALLPFSSSAYFNSLTNPASFPSDFINYSVGGGSFTINEAYGLQLTSTAPDPLEGIQAFNTYFSASKNCTVTVRAHVSAFTNNQINPFYRAGLVFAKVGPDFAATSQNVINLQLERSSNESLGSSMFNAVASVLNAGGVETSSVSSSVGQNEDF